MRGKWCPSFHAGMAPHELGVTTPVGVFTLRACTRAYWVLTSRSTGAGELAWIPFQGETNQLGKSGFPATALLDDKFERPG